MHAVRDNIPDDAVPPLAHNEYAQDDFNKFADLALRRHPVGRLSASTGGDLARSRRYRTILEPLGWGDELRVVFVAGKLSWGFICLHRHRSDAAFSRDEELFFSGLIPHVADGLRKALLIGSSTFDQPDDLGPGLLEVTDDLEVAAMNSAAAGWLAEGGMDSPRSEGQLPQAVYAVVSRLKALEANPLTAAAPRLRIRARSGRWLVFHASRLRGRGADGRIGIVIETAKPVEIAPLIAQAFALSERESEVCLLILRGLSTTQMSARLHISTYTVQDHLKAIFDKVVVRSRRQLVGRIFFDQYWPLNGSGPGRRDGFTAWS
jgi:DNA-binding CsgD family transcriptional regulator